MNKLLQRTGILLIIMIIIVSFLVAKLYRNMPAMNEKINTVVLDAGHGMPDGGAVGSVKKVLETDINFAVTMFLKELLEEEGIKVILTRDGKNSSAAEGDRPLRERYLSDMKRRVNISNDSNADALISIHMNHYPDPSCQGPQVFYSSFIKGSEELAFSIRQAFIDNIKENCQREIKPVTNELYLLREAKIPAVIVECGFLSNPAEEELLSDENYQKKLAKSIAEGIMKCYT